MASAASASREGQPLGEEPPRFLDLPLEAQNLIFSHCSQGNLICLSLVSKHFRDLAATQLYRHFHIVFPDEDDPAFDSPIDSLAGGLETLATSDYNYARHLRDISLDTLSAGEKAESAYKPYLYSTSCGKFLNTLFLIALRQAKSLETFTWNIRVELSRPVYKALHQINSLKHLHVRLQAGPSLYELPPPLPFSTSTTAPPPNPTTNNWHTPVILTPPPPVGLLPVSNLFTPPPGITILPSLQQHMHLPGLAISQPPPQTPVQPPSLPPAPKTCPPKSKRKPPVVNVPATISGFKKLKSLAILDIDNLELVSEIKSCVESSSMTLNKLKLSFSPSLAVQSRKPNSDYDPDGDDDDFQVVPISSAPWSDAAAPVKAFHAQEERKRQEEVLARIFGVNPVSVETAQKKAKDKKEKEKPSPDDTRSGAEIFMKRLVEVSAKLIASAEGSEQADIESRQGILDMIEDAAAKYLNSDDTKGTTQTSKPNPLSDAFKVDKETPTTDAADAPLSPPKHSTRFGFEGTLPEDINVEEPILDEADDILETREAAEKEMLLSASSSTAKPTPSSSVRSRSPAASKAASSSTEEAAEEPANALQLKDGSDSATMTAYIRATRGVPIHSFSIHLIPVKASVLKASLDLRVLKKLTLLNVGSQNGIWSMLSKENKISPLPLRKIFTDNVSIAFLTFVAQLEEVEDLFMLERAENYRPESFAPQTSTSMDQIRRLVLRRHIHKIKRLMIKNDVDFTWDADEKTVLLLCNRGKSLEELAVSMGIRAMHTFLQHFPGLPKLHALNVVHFRSDDTCPWVMRETRKFLIDNLSHHPELVLEWISIDDDRVERIIRGPFPPDRRRGDKKKGKGKGKGKATASSSYDSETNSFPALPLHEWDSASDSDDDDTDISAHLKLDTFDGVHFYDVWGVRIFKKEIMTGRL